MLAVGNYQSHALLIGSKGYRVIRSLRQRHLIAAVNFL